MAAYKKKRVPKAIREAVWIKHVGRRFDHKCLTHWCPNKMTVFDFQTSHNIPESKGGSMELDNLYPLCGRCNQSMGNKYTYDEWHDLFIAKSSFWRRIYNSIFVSTSKATPATPSLAPESISTNPLISHHDILQVV